MGIYWLLTCFRFIMGIGIGGEYPCCASHTAEASDFKTSGRNMAISIASAVVGGVVAPSVVLLCLALRIPHAMIWRLAFGFGALVSLFSLGLRVVVAKNSSKFESVQGRQSVRRSFKILWEQ